MSDELDLDVCSPSSSSCSSPDDAANGHQMTLVPPDLVSVLIDAKGERLKRIAKETQTIIKVWKDEASRRHTDPVKVLIIGQAKNRKIASRKVDDLIRGIESGSIEQFVENLAMGKDIQDDYCTGWEQAVRIPGCLVQSLIGPNGRNLRELAGFSKATLKVERHKDGRARIMVSGTSAAKLDAKRTLLQFIERYEQKQAQREQFYKRKVAVAEAENLLTKEGATAKCLSAKPPRGAPGVETDTIWQQTQRHIEQMKRALLNQVEPPSATHLSENGTILGASRPPEVRKRPDPEVPPLRITPSRPQLPRPRGTFNENQQRDCSSNTSAPVVASATEVFKAQPLYPPVGNCGSDHDATLHEVTNVSNASVSSSASGAHDPRPTFVSDVDRVSAPELKPTLSHPSALELALLLEPEPAEMSDLDLELLRDLESALLPEPEPTLLPEPKSTLMPEPEPTLRPEPKSTSLSEPEPTSLPDREPTLAPEPKPTQVPEPEPMLVPEPTLTPDAEPMLGSIPAMDSLVDEEFDDDSDWDAVDSMEEVEEWEPDQEDDAPDGDLEWEPQVNTASVEDVGLLFTSTGDHEFDDEYDPFNTFPGDNDDVESLMSEEEADAVLVCPPYSCSEMDPSLLDPIVQGTAVDSSVTADVEYAHTPTDSPPSSRPSPLSIAAAIAASLQGASTASSLKGRTGTAAAVDIADHFSKRRRVANSTT